MIARNFSSCVTNYAHPGNAGPPDPNEWKYGILLAAEEVVRAGVLSYAPGSESERFTCFTFHRLVMFVGWCLFVGGALFALCGSFWLADQSVRSCYQPMTSSA